SPARWLPFESVAAASRSLLFATSHNQFLFLQAGEETSAALQPPVRTANCSDPRRETNLQGTATVFRNLQSQ
ncbi:hypothetical protein A2U01_0080343, partial [Trifolium medium]|nr:hypothetical protein [Trifolium medium]